MDERTKAIDVLLDGCHSFQLNMNDTFAYACGDSEEMIVDDFEKMVPIIAKHGHHALTAYVAVKRKAEPISCKCHHDGQPYKDARKEIEALKAADEYFMMD